METSEASSGGRASINPSRRTFLGILIAVPVLILVFVVATVLDIMIVTDSEKCDPSENSALFEMTDKELDALCGPGRDFDIIRN